ncbi:MAG: hypothetical protein EA379_04355 [Phycisphaerales bacterium]|nr:MAG: hypothetical protein EA379_04355 [Phycisphaerales bacterium]
MSIDVRVISIGTLAEHPLWGERTPVRTGHATTTLIHAGQRVILVDPGLPQQALIPRLYERANIGPNAVTDVFLTCFRPDVRRALRAFDRANWWIHDTEREMIGTPLIQKLHEALDTGDEELSETLEREVEVMRRCNAAPDNLAPHIDIFPLPGVTPGMCGLLIALPRMTLLICGDAVPTVEHLEEGKVLPDCADVDRARASFAEAVEIADMLVLGRDNIVVNPTKRPF